MMNSLLFRSIASFLTIDWRANILRLAIIASIIYQPTHPLPSIQASSNLPTYLS